MPRTTGWRPMFGQTGAAQRHLAGNDVGVGDLFLFFGWFRQTERHRGRLRYVPDAPDLHLIFGWLEVGQVWRVGEHGNSIPRYARRHPHAVANFGPANTIYVAAGNPRTGWRAGAFEQFDSRLQLTAPDKLRSHWRLPSWFCPRPDAPPLSYHSRADRWRRSGEYVLLRSVGRGQEFVLDTTHYPQACAWTQEILSILSV